MTTLSHFSTFLSPSARIFSFIDQLQAQHHQPKLHWFSYHDFRRSECLICACSLRNFRVRKKVKSDEELFNDICDFIESVGLPEDHVPSTKELSQHGRNDLANIVRRRGYKRIRELLTNSKTVKNDSDTNNTILTVTGQDGEVEDVVEDLASTGKDLMLEKNSRSLNTNLPSSSNGENSTPTITANSLEEEELSYDLECHDENNESHKINDENIDEVNISLTTEVAAAETASTSPNTGSNIQCNDYNGGPMECSHSLHPVKESRYSLNYQSGTINNMDNEYSLSPNVPSRDNYMRSSTVDEDLNLDGLDDKSMLLKIGFSSKEEALYCLNEQVEKEDNNLKDVPSSVEMRITDDYSSDFDVDQALNHDGSSYKLIKSSENSSLAEKVAKFMKNGDLDMTDDNFDVILSGSGAGESSEFIGTVNTEDTPINIHGEACSEEAVSRDTEMASEHILSSTTADPLFRDDQSSTEASNGQIGKEMGAEVQRRGKENQVEVDRLRFMLHQKELELSQLKKQIEREKLTLSAFQSKAETEISRAQKLILEKDTELRAAEESLSGLKEVQIDYCGDGEIVEVAGSFNGWHHGIKMDLEPSSNNLDSLNSRKSRLWSTVLWLYPGEYEIKFIVDGHWTIDPQRELVTKGAICNNIFRVEK